MSKPRRAAWKWRERVYWFQQWKKPAEFPTWIVEAKRGQGKTRYMALEAVKDMRRGVRVASNFTVRDRLTGQESERADSWVDVLRLSVDALENGEPIKFYVDELHLWMDSRAFKLTPAWFRGWLAQSRHYGAGLCGSVQNLRRLEIVARELVDELLVVKKWNFRLFLLWGPFVPLHWLGTVDEDSIGTDEMGDATVYKFKGWRLWFARWWAGYDTRELIQVEPWCPDAELQKEVDELIERAAALVAPGLISAYADSVTAWERGSLSPLLHADALSGDCGESADEARGLGTVVAICDTATSAEDAVCASAAGDN